MQYTCTYCKQVFNRSPGQVRNAKTVCCSRICADKLKKITHKGKNNGNYKTGTNVNKHYRYYRKESDFRAAQ